MRVKVQAGDFSTALLARLSPNSNPPFDFDAMMLGWNRSGLDPDPFALFHSSQIPTQAAPGLPTKPGSMPSLAVRIVKRQRRWRGG